MSGKRNGEIAGRSEGFGLSGTREFSGAGDGLGKTALDSSGREPAGWDWGLGTRITMRHGEGKFTANYKPLREPADLGQNVEWAGMGSFGGGACDGARPGGGDVWWCGGGPVMLARCWEGVWSMRQTISSTQHTGSHHTRAGSAGCKAPPRRGRRGRLVECWRSIDRSRASCSGQTCKRGRGRGQLGKGCGPRRRDRPMGADS